MDFSLTDKRRDILAKMGRIGRETIRPSTGRYENGTQSAVDTFRAFGRKRLLNLTIRAEPGGQVNGAHGADPLLYLLASEETARYYPRHRGLHGLLTKARKVSGGYIVNGEKNHATLMRIEARLMSRRICS